MKLLLAAALSVSTVAAFAPAPFAVRSMTAVRMAEYDLDYGKTNSYVPAENADGGQGQFGAVSPNDWKVPGTSPVGEASYGGADDGSDEPWFSEAVSTVSLDLDKADATLKAFTKDAATFKIEAFAATKPLKLDYPELGPHIRQSITFLVMSGAFETILENLSKSIICSPVRSLCITYSFTYST
jgi:hypothetical protein